MAVFGLIVIGLYVMALLILMGTSTYDTWGGVLIAPVLFLATLPALRRQAVREGDPRLFTLLCWGLVAKLAGGVAKFAFA